MFETTAQPLSQPHTRPAAKPLGYRPQLDALRAFAVLSVLVSHFWVDHGAGGLGVRLFFVLSGFLISAILLGQKSTDRPLGAKLRVFFARRILRIWPIYYAVLLAAWAVNLGGIRPSIAWHLLQLSNIYYLLRGDWEPWVAAHLWTLSVEEQFYLIWPFVVLLLPPAGIRAVLAVIIGGSVLARAIGPLLSEDAASMAVVITAPFDALGLGAAIAVALHCGVTLERLRRLFAPAALVSAIALAALALLPLPRLWLALEFTLFGVIFAYLVVGGSIGFGGWAGRVLDNPAIVYCGRISYGIYLFHLFVWAAVTGLAWRLGYDLSGTGPVTFVAMSACTLAAAMASWHLFERPINALKRYFPYRAPDAKMFGRPGEAGATSA